MSSPSAPVRRCRRLSAGPVLGAVLLLLTALPVTAEANETIALTGGTVIDVSGWGTSTNDIDDAVVVMTDGTIIAVGPAASTPIPDGAVVVDCRGAYLVPGLVDGFAALNHQAYANAYLAMGVTSVLGVESTRRGPLDLDSDPSPHIYRLGDVGYEEAPLPQLLAAVDEQHRLGMDAVLVMYGVGPEQMGAVIDRVHELDMAVIGELARTTYVEAARLGADAFVHTSRYSLDLAPDELRRGVADEPFSDQLGSAKWNYYQLLPELAQDREPLEKYGRQLAEAGAALLPTFSLGYLDRPGHGNPWSYPVAAVIDPRDVHWPADRETGEHAYTAEKATAYRELAEAELKIDSAYFAAGCRYLAGSGADVWGTMPGISLHHELEALCAIGHTPRQALATATGNFAEVMGWSELGGIEAGRRADLLVLNSDPRRDVHHLQDIRTVYLAGRALDPQQLSEPVILADGQLLSLVPMDLPAEVLDADGHPLPATGYLDSVQISDITYMSDGLRVVGHLVVPEGDGPFPCLIYNRGGNREFGANSPLRAALRLARFASWGYIVVASQYRGNAGGEGREEFGGAEVADVLNLIPLLGSIARADTSRIGMIGHSRGGLMTYLALARTDRLDAAVVSGGVTDSYLVIEDRPDMEQYVYAELVPDYEQVKDAALAARSPILWTDQLCKTTPILLLHGSADWRVHPTSALRMADALYASRHPFRFVFLEGADHGLSEYRDEVARMIRDWLDRYVRDEAPLPDLEPHGP